MSDVNLARRATAGIFFSGVDITESLSKYFISLTYIDSEEDEADDLQIKLQDRDGIWLESWLGQMIEAASESSKSDTQGESPDGEDSLYRVTAKSGLNIRKGPGTGYALYGALVYGSVVQVESFSNDWAQIQHNGNPAYVSAEYLEKVDTSADGWAIGDSVIANGQPQYTSYGSRPGDSVTDYEGTITSLNIKNGVPYPIHVSSLGWFAENQVRKLGATVSEREQSEITPSTALKIQAVIATKNWNGDGKDKVLDCGQFELDSIDASGPPSEITIKATALPYTSTIRQTKKTRAWESYHLSGIANEIAKVNGMTCMYLSETDPYYKRAEQYSTPDINFLSERCKESGISLKASNNILVLFDQTSYESKDSVLTIRKGDRSYIKYKVGTSSAKTKYSSCRVRWTASSGELIEGIAKVEDYKEDSKSNQQLEIKAKVSSISEATTLAAKSLRKHNKYEKTATFTLPGNPALVAGVTVGLEEWGAWSGKYIISQARHTLGSSYTVQIKLRKVLEGY